MYTITFIAWKYRCCGVDKRDRKTSATHYLALILNQFGWQAMQTQSPGPGD